MIDRKYIGMALDPGEAIAERGQMLLFAKATGQAGPVYLDDAAARLAGYRGLLAPPTFAACLHASSRQNPLELFEKLEIDLASVLHGSQSFRYFGPICSGDILLFESHIADIFDKKSGSLQFVVQKTTGKNQTGERVVEIESTIIVRAKGAGA